MSGTSFSCFGTANPLAQTLPLAPPLVWCSRTCSTWPNGQICLNPARTVLHSHAFQYSSAAGSAPCLQRPARQLHVDYGLGDIELPGDDAGSETGQPHRVISSCGGANTRSVGGCPIVRVSARTSPAVLPPLSARTQGETKKKQGGEL
jgi:hypothetical protein